MHVLGIGHVGITVRNLEKSVEFYTRVFHFKVIDAPCDMIKDQEESAGCGVPGCFHRYCLLQAPGGQQVEFMEYDKVPSPVDHALPLNQIGQHHISLLVDNVASSVEELEKLGIEMVYHPLAAGNEHWVLFRDPDGIIVEMMGR